MDNQTKGPKAANEIDKHIIGPIMTYNADRLAETTSAYLAARAKLDNPNNKDRLGALKVLCRAEEKMKDALAAYRSAQSGEVEGADSWPEWETHLRARCLGFQARSNPATMDFFQQTFNAGVRYQACKTSQNTPPQSVGHDELVERLRDLLVSPREHLKRPTVIHIEEDALQAAITALSQPISPWCFDMDKAPESEVWHLVISKYDYPNGVVVKWDEGSLISGWVHENGERAFGPDDTLICRRPIAPHQRRRSR